jgi:hypothetical protein
MRFGELRAHVLHLHKLVLAMLLEKPGELVREELRADSGPARSWTSIMASTKRSVRFVKRWAIQSRVRASLRPLPVVARPKDPAFVDLTHAGALQKRSLGPYAWRLFGFVLALVVTVSLSWIFYSRNQYSPKIRSLAVLPMDVLAGFHRASP